MKSNKILFLIAAVFLCSTMTAQEWQAEKNHLELSELKINDQKFLAIIDSAVIMQNIKEKDYVYSVFVTKDSADYSIVIETFPLLAIGHSDNMGFFKYKNEMFIVEGFNPDSLFSVTEKKKSISYTRYFADVKGVRMYLDEQPEESATWIFSYSPHNMKLKETYWTSEKAELNPYDNEYRAVRKTNEDRGVSRQEQLEGKPTPTPL
ncbi:MAG: hypothetical protein FWF54_02360 [Candidatus Azobacteroides sp.]|nr:hypothetical protein [Candidatus Azobacteroides sp.]